MSDYSGITKMLYDWQTLIAGILAVLAAVGTIAATIYTARKQIAVANGQTEAVKAQNNQLKRQHEDEFKPICMFVPYDGVDPWYERRDLLTLSADPSDSRSARLELWCVLRNIGRGPATGVVIMLRLLDKEGQFTQPWELAPVGSGEQRGSEGNPLAIPLQFATAHARADAVGSVTINSLQVILAYRDIFGKPFHTIHHMNTLEAEKYYRPPHIAVRQAWATFHDGEPA